MTIKYAYLIAWLPTDNCPVYNNVAKVGGHFLKRVYGDVSQAVDDCDRLNENAMTGTYRVYSVPSTPDEPQIDMFCED